MIKVKLNITPKCQLEAEVETVKDMFRVIGDFSTVLSETNCGSCNSERIVMGHRIAKGYDFYELECADCHCRLSFGQHKEGETLFPKRDKGKNGWHRYEKGDDQGEQSQESSPPRSAPPTRTSDMEKAIPF